MKYLISLIVSCITIMTVTMFIQNNVIEKKQRTIDSLTKSLQDSKIKLSQLPQLEDSINIIKRRSPAVGGQVVQIRDSINEGKLVTKLIDDLPATDLAIVNKEKILKHGLGKYVTREEFSYPVANPSESYISSEYGSNWITVPINGKLRRVARVHNGIDIVSKDDTRVLSVQNGTVIYKKYNDRIYGNYIIIRHKVNGEWYLSGYAHLSEIKVKYNQVIDKGQLIGIIGNSGESFGMHLHYVLYKYNSTVRKYRTVNPLFTTTYNVPVETTNYKGMRYY